jgi:polyhydroxybutyrate depolymerase
MSRVSLADHFPMRRSITVLGLLCVFAAFSLSCGLGATARKGQGTASDSKEKPLVLRVDGQERRYYVHVPPGLDAQQPTPLVIALHGGGATAKSIIEGSKLSAIADREKFVVVYPESVNRQWNNGSKGGSLKVRHGNADDVRFISELIDLVASERNIDPRRIFATGMSMGAMMCYRLACELSNRIAAISPVAGPLPVELKGCKPSRPVPVMAIHGTDDPIVPYAGGSYGGLRRKLGDVLSAEDTVHMFARLNGCSDKPTLADPVDRKPDDGTRVIKRTYAECREGASVELLTVEGGGHVWPRGKQYLPSQLVGRVTQEIGSGAIWEFFKAHPMSRAPGPA